MHKNNQWMAEKNIWKVALASLVLAPLLSHANSQFSQTTIETLVVHDYGTDIVIELAGDVSNNESCTVNYQLVLSTSHPLFDPMFSALLSAFHAGTTIQGWVNGCHQWGMPILTRLDLKK